MRNRSLESFNAGEESTHGIVLPRGNLLDPVYADRR